MQHLKTLIFFYRFAPDYLHVGTWVSDEDGLSGLLRGRAARMEKHASGLRREDAILQEESLRHGDVVFVDVVDTYRNVPSKLLQFYKWYAKC